MVTVTLKKVYDRNVMNKYRLYLLIGVIILNLIDYMCVCLFEDIRQINSMAISSINSGIIILGGGVSKHHVCNANIMVSFVHWEVVCHGQ